VVIFIGLDPTRTLVISQVALSFGLPMAVIPLIVFTSKKQLMGILVNRTATKVLASLAAAVIVALNVYLLYSVFAGG
jgi:manganese transport protein